ncbi:MAG: glycosyltransferase, partial [Kofleriaceae bacterium]
MISRPRIVCALQLPPPLHGVTAINAQLVASETLAGRFELDVVPMQFSETVAELGTISLGKLVEATAVGARLAAKLASRPAALYISMAVQRPACFRDAGYLAIARALGVPRIVHLHARPDRAVLPLLRQALHGATVILLSPALRADLGDAVSDTQVRYVPNGIEDPGEPVERTSRPPRVLFLSNLLAEKGPLVLVDALAVLAARGVAFEATFAGAPSRELGEAELRAAIVRGGIGEHARYLGPVEAAA